MNQNNIHRVIILFTTITVFFLLTVDLKANDSIPIVKNGTIDLSEYDFEREANVQLHGQWKFYNNKFLSPKEIQNDNNYCFVKVPKNLKNQICANDTISYWGYGTYHLRVILNKKFKNQRFKILTEGIHSSSKIFINDVLVGYGGKITKTKEGAVPELELHLYDFLVKTDTLNIVVQTSNYSMRKFGFLYTVEFGLSEKIRKSDRTRTSLYMLVIGGFIMMILYHFVLYFFRRNEKLTLYFALSAFVLTIHTFSYNELYFDIFYNFSFEFQIGLRRIAAFLYTGFSALFLYHAFKDEFNKTVLKIIVSISIFRTILTILIPLRINSTFLIYFYIIAILASIYYVYVIIKAYKNKREGAGVLFWGIAINVIFIGNDVLHDLHIIHTIGHLAPFGFFVRTFSQAVFIAVKFNNAFTRNKKLLVDKTTLTLANKEKDVLIQEIHHRVKNNLQSISSIVDMQIMSLDDDIQKNILTQTHSRIIAMSLVHEMLYSQNDLSYIKLKEYIDKLILTVNKMVNADNLAVKFNLDIDNINLSVSNCISLGMLTSEAITNSIKYAFENTKNPEININVSHDKKTEILYFNIKDNGLGIEEDVISGEKTSFGMRLIQIFAAQLKADIQLKNNCGTEIELSFIPKNQKI